MNGKSISFLPNKCDLLSINLADGILLVTCTCIIELDLIFLSMIHVRVT